MDVQFNEVFEECFKGKYPLPTDNIRQQNQKIVEEYILVMRNSDELEPIKIATESNNRIGETILISEAVASGEKIFIIDGHHRYNASLATKYPLKGIFVKPVALDYQCIGTLYDYLDAYEYWQRR